MSAARALVPEHAPAPPSGRPLEVVSSRAQRRARPKLAYALVTLAGLFAILVAQLLMSIALSEGAYEIAGLQQERRELNRDIELLAEELHVLESPQHLAANAVALGMVANSNTAYLRLDDGSVLGSAVAATTRDGIVLGPEGLTLVPNALLEDVTIATAAQEAASTTESAEGAVASESGPLPAITTR